LFLHIGALSFAQVQTDCDDVHEAAIVFGVLKSSTGFKAGRDAET
jgi:hypothetical protein